MAILYSFTPFYGYGGIMFSFSLYMIEIRLNIFERVENLVMEAFVTLLITYLITAIHELVFFYQQWKHHFSKSVRLEKDNIQAKYETLKTQINPHFLFNSLNSLTNLVDDNEAAIRYISDLSDFFRYMLGSRRGSAGKYGQDPRLQVMA